MRTVAKTDIGRVRTVNEDRVLVKDGIAGGCVLAIVADGMGGHRAGDIASQMAIEQIESFLSGLDPELTEDGREQAISAAIKEANRSVFEFASRQEQFHGMGTTVVALLASKERLIVGHIGDSRAYLADGERIVRLTDDHSLVGELLRSGQITAEEAHHHPRRNVLTRALGTEPNVKADVQRFDWKPGDIVLLCSDGLSGLVPDDALLEVLRAGEDLEWKVDRLVKQALEAGGDDNISVVLLESLTNATKETG